MADHGSVEADDEFGKMRMKALQRDNYTCIGCGFRSIKWQEVHHVDDDHHNNDVSNLATVCSFCHNCQHIGFAGMNKEAVLIWMPELSQADINHIVRTALVADRWFANMKEDVSSEIAKLRHARRLAEAGSNVRNSLLERQGDVEARLGTSDPAELASALMELPDHVYDQRDKFLSGVRLLPLGHRVVGGNDRMKEMTQHWLENGGPYYSTRPSTWAQLRKNIFG